MSLHRRENNGIRGSPIPIEEGNMEMLWIAIAASLILFALFLYFRFRGMVKKIERDIFF
jgi:hypothetical protein